MNPIPSPPLSMLAARPSGRLRTVLLLALLALAIVPMLACADDDAPVTGLTRETFADVIVELRTAEREALGTDSASAVYERRKAEILERHGTSEAELREFVQGSTRDLQELEDLWEEIADRLREPLLPDSADPAPDTVTGPLPDSLPTAPPPRSQSADSV